MAGEWRRCTIDELCDARVAELQTGPFGSQLHAHDYVDEGVAIVPTEAIRNRRIDHSVLPKISPTKAQQLVRHRLQPGDILFARRGVQATGHVGCIREAEDGFICGTGAIRLRVNEQGNAISTDFISHVLADPASVGWFKFHAIGATMPNLNEGIIRSFPFALPPLDEQRAIAHILGTLDEKIELNRRMNETLEAMARALFKSWFVDFDPVRAKAEGRNPGLPKPLAHRFPDSFEDSDLGKIPKGWEVGTLGDLVAQRVERCVASPETTARPYVPIDCISSKSLFLKESKSGEEAQSSLAKFYKGDLLFGAMRPYFHKVCIAPFDGTTRTTAFVLFARRSEDFAFATLLLHHPDTIDYATRHSTGSTIPYAVWSNSLEDMPVMVPPSAVREAFDGIVRPALDRIPQPYFENRTLAALRDTLLPKLIYGQVRVRHLSPGLPPGAESAMAARSVPATP